MANAFGTNRELFLCWISFSDYMLSSIRVCAHGTSLILFLSRIVLCGDIGSMSTSRILVSVLTSCYRQTGEEGRVHLLLCFNSWPVDTLLLRQDIWEQPRRKIVCLRCFLGADFSKLCRFLTTVMSCLTWILVGSNRVLAFIVNSVPSGEGNTLICITFSSRKDSVSVWKNYWLENICFSFICFKNVYVFYDFSERFSQPIPLSFVSDGRDKALLCGCFLALGEWGMLLQDCGCGLQFWSLSCWACRTAELVGWKSKLFQTILCH